GAAESDGAGARAGVPHLGVVRVPRVDGQLPDLDLPRRRAEQDPAHHDAAVPRGEPRSDDRGDLVGPHPPHHRGPAPRRPARRPATPDRLLSDTMPAACDLLIDGGLVLTLDPEDRVIEDGAVAITADRIVAVETAATARVRFAPHRRIDARRHIVMPGLVNTHN